MKKDTIATHKLDFKMDGSYWHSQKAYGVKDLFNCISQMQKDGYTQFNITVLKKYTK